MGRRPRDPTPAKRSFEHRKTSDATERTLKRRRTIVMRSRSSFYQAFKFREISLDVNTDWLIKKVKKIRPQVPAVQH